MPNCSAPLPAEAVAEAAGGEQQTANTSVYESTIHCSWLVVASRSFCSVGNATLRIELSTMITSRLRQSTPRIHQRWW